MRPTCPGTVREKHDSPCRNPRTTLPLPEAAQPVRRKTGGISVAACFLPYRAVPAVSPPSTISPLRPKWMLSVAFLLAVPVPYSMVVVGGMVPAFCILYIAIHGLLVAFPKSTAEGLIMLGILWTHVVVPGGLLYPGAAGISWFLFRVFPAQFAKAVVLMLVVALSFAATFDICRAPGHNSAPPADIFRICRALIP